MKISSKLLIWLVMGLGVGWGWQDKSQPADLLTKLLTQYRQAQDEAQREAAQRDQLALQAQSAIIRMKDAELRMEKYQNAAWAECAAHGKGLVTSGGWRCEAPKKPDPGKEQKK